MNGAVSFSHITFLCCVWHFVFWQTTTYDRFSHITFRFRPATSRNEIQFEDKFVAFGRQVCRVIGMVYCDEEVSNPFSSEG